MRRTPRFGEQAPGVMMRAAASRAPSHGSPGTAPAHPMSLSLPARPSVLHRDQWRNKYLHTLGMPVTSRSGARRRSSVGRGAGEGAGAGASGVAASPGSAVSAPRAIPGSSPATSSGPTVAMGSTRSAGHTPNHGVDADDFMYVEDDVFGWSNSISFANPDSDAGALPSEDRVGAMASVRFGSGQARTDRGGSSGMQAASFVPPHRLVSRDCFSLGVRREFRTAKAPM